MGPARARPGRIQIKPLGKRFGIFERSGSRCFGGKRDEHSWFDNGLALKRQLFNKLSPEHIETPRQNMADNTPEVMTIEETAQYLRVPLSSLYKLAQSGRIPYQKVGRGKEESRNRDSKTQRFSDSANTSWHEGI